MKYSKNAAGNYVLDTGKDRLEMGTVVSILFERDGLLLKHGQPHLVKLSYMAMRTALTMTSMEKEAENLVMVTGAFDLEDLNNMLECSGMASRLFDTAATQEGVAA